MKILNLYAGIGGNRKLWENVDITAIEYDETIANIYKDFYPNDNVIVTDANEYLLNHYNEYDLIWSSPPCQSHSKIRMCSSFSGKYKPVLPDMNLWQEIIFLKQFCKNKWVVENVIPYYKPLITPTVKIDRHYFWSNFPIENFTIKEEDKRKHEDVKGKAELYGFNISKYKTKIKKEQIIRNCVIPTLGQYILKQAFKDVV